MTVVVILYIHNERPASRFYSTNRSTADDHGRVFWDVGFIVCVFCKTLQTTHWKTHNTMTRKQHYQQKNESGI